MAETFNQFGVPEHHIRQFTSNVMMDIQRTGGIFRMCVTQGSYTGEGAQAVLYIGQARFKKRQNRWADTELTELSHTQRWIAPEDQDFATLVDRIDRLRMIYDPTSPYVEAVRIGYGVAEDDTILGAFFANALVGKNGSTVAPFDTANQSIAHAGTGLSVAKLRATRKLFKQKRVALLGVRTTNTVQRGEQPYIAPTAKHIDDLLSETQTTSSDFAAIKALVDGEINRFMGFEFVQCEDVPTDPADASTFWLPAWVQSGMHLGDWENMNIQITPRADKNNIPQIHANFTQGATRLHEKKVIQVQAK
jgi:hypothetical protein